MRKFRNRKLPRGIYIDRGYVFIRIFPNGQLFLKGVGPAYDSKVINDAVAILSQYRTDIRLGKFNLEQETKRITVEDACNLFWELHASKSRSSKSFATYIKYMKEAFEGRFFDSLTYFDIEDYRKRREQAVKASTVNKEQACITSVYNKLKEWVRIKKIKSVKLPVENPCRGVKKANEGEFARERVPSRQELVDAYKWCRQNDLDLWNAIEQAIITTQRKQDLIGLQKKTRVRGVQGKTGTPFSLPMVVETPASFVNFRRRWDALRTAMGWIRETLEDGTPNEKHTTWHDLRHVGPTMLAELDYSARVIKQFTGHVKEANVERYVNPRDGVLKPAIEDLQKELKAIKV